MKLSDILYEAAVDLWEQAADKPFVKEMALGTLDEGRFRNYMLQDYLYLLDYTDLLRFIRERTEDPGLLDFLQSVIRETEKETYRVHVPHMKKLGVSDEEIADAIRLPVIGEYTGYMLSRVREDGLFAGLAALLQCSWLYAYIGERTVLRYPRETAASPYSFWFDAYTCKAYTDANRLWIEVLDRETDSIEPDTVSLLSKIFRTCAGYENRLWDELYML
ncbi:MAG TPA: hypothetical protein DCL38_10465 [Lachnospiraceae bacterium]|nr:hypothetical protein [Lachnospiraceae bacterium]